MEDVNAIDARCGLCGYKCVKYKKLRRHYQKAHPECDLLSCPFCDLVTSDRREMKRHKKVEHRLDRIGCSICDFSTKSWRTWTQHKDTMHQAGVTEDIQIKYEMAEHSLQDHEAPATSAGKRYKKKMSGGRVLSNGRTDQPTKKVSNSNQEFPTDLLSDQSQHEQSLHSITDNTCATCGKNYTSARRLSRHQLKHAAPFKCSSCDFSCKHASDLKTHALSHADVSPFYCELCDTVFTKKISLVYHQRIHSGDRPFQCQYCEYAASTKPTLDQHLRSHSGKKPYQCKLCDYATAYRSNLVYHVVTHSAERPFTCEICSRAFKRKDHLQSHLRTNHEYKL